MDGDFLLMAGVQLALILLGIYWMLQRNDEMPLLVAGFMFYVASYRFWAVTTGLGEWVNIAGFGSFSFATITEPVAIGALKYIVLGEAVFLAAYCLRQKTRIPVVAPIADPVLLAWLRPKALALGMIALPLAVATRSRVMGALEAGRSMAFEVSSYLYLFPLVLVGVATLILCLWRFGGVATKGAKVAAGLVLAGLAHLSFSATGRFQFLGWIIAGSVVLSCCYGPAKRLVALAILGAAGMCLFAIAGALRNVDRDPGEMKQAAWQRAFSAEDANMLDGFVLLQQVHPRLLPFSYGMEHLEILMRPIPRSIWKNKPVGGYMNKLGLIGAEAGFTLGISPTLFGSFYAEGGAPAIVIFSAIYGFALAWLVMITQRLAPFGAVMARSIPCAALVPLLRGGDLPGVYAWIGMAFWPCFLVLWLKRKELRGTASRVGLPVPPQRQPVPAPAAASLKTANVPSVVKPRQKVRPTPRFRPRDGTIPPGAV